jgi:hypothetical protein
LTILAIASLVAARPVAAQTAPGGGLLAGRIVFAVKGCGRERSESGIVASVAADGTWVATTEGRTYSGSWTPLGPSGRLLDLSFDAGSLAEFLSTLTDDASALCRAPVTVTSATRRRFALALDRRRTRAKVTLRYHLTGATAAGAGSASYRLTAKGPWAPG